MPDLFGNSIAYLNRVLDLRTLRHNVISSNLANLETPNYKAKEVKFEAQLKRAFDRKLGGQMTTSNPRHLGGSSDAQTIRAEITQAPGVPRSDGNQVDIDREMSQLAQNQILYNATIQMISKKLQGIRMAIDGGGQQ